MSFRGLQALKGLANKPAQSLSSESRDTLTDSALDVETTIFSP
jgi:hypothetical protein